MTQRNDLSFKQLILDYPENRAKFIAILESGVDLSLKNDGQTAIEFAADKNLWEYVELIATKCKTDVPDTYHFSYALLKAAEIDRCQTMAILLRAGAQINVRDKDGNSPLDLAIRRRSIPTIHLLLLGQTYNPQGQKQCPLVLACTLEYWDIVDVLLDYYTKTLPHNPDDPSEIAEVLCKAVRAGRKNIVKKILKIPGVANSYNMIGVKTPLHHAIEHGHHDLVKLLIEAGAKLDTAYETPMQLAARLKDIKSINIIVYARKTDENDSYRYGAALNVLEADDAQEATETALLLLNAGAKPDEVLNPKRDTALHIAARKGYTEIIKELINRNANLALKNDDNLTPMQVASDEPVQFAAIDAIVASKGATDDSDSFKYSYALLRAVNSGRNETAIALLNAGAKATEHWHTLPSRNTALHWAALKGNEELTQLLTRHLVPLDPVNSTGQTPIVTAAAAGHFNCVVAIAKSQQDVTGAFKYDVALLAAVKANQPVETIRALLDAKAKTTHRDDETLDTVAHLAATLGRVDLLELLINAGADFFATNKKGSTPVQSAARAKQWIFICALAKRKKEDVSKSISGLCYGSALVEAIRHQQPIETVKTLLDAGANTQWQTSGGKNTCLHLALTNDDMPTLELLLAAKADINVKNNDDRTVIELALHLKRWDMLKILVSRVKDAAVLERTFYFAVQSNQLEVVRAILVATKGEITALLSSDGHKNLYDLAIDNDSAEMIKLLVEYHVQYNNSQRKIDSLNYSYQKNRWKCAVELAKHKDAKATGELLVRACKANQFELAMVLLNKGAAATTVDESKNSPLYWAVTHNNPDFVRELLKKGVLQQVVGDGGETTLELAARLGHSKIVEILVADVAKHTEYAKDSFRYGSALKHTVKRGDCETIKIICAGNTVVPPLSTNCLFEAITMNRPDVITMLRLQGCGVDDKKDGKTPADFALEMKRYDCWLSLHTQIVDGLTELKDFEIKAKQISQSLDDAGLTPAATAAALKQLKQYDEAILQHDLAELLKRRHMGNTDANTNFIQTINLLLKSNDQMNGNLPELQAANGIEAIHLGKFTAHRSQARIYAKEVLRWLDLLKEDIARTKFKVRKLAIGLVAGVPTHLKPIKTALDKVNKESIDSILETYVNVMDQLMKIPQDPTREPETNQFYERYKSTGNAIIYSKANPPQVVSLELPAASAPPASPATLEAHVHGLLYSANPEPLYFPVYQPTQSVQPKQKITESKAAFFPPKQDALTLLAGLHPVDHPLPTPKIAVPQ